MGLCYAVVPAGRYDICIGLGRKRCPPARTNFVGRQDRATGLSRNHQGTKEDHDPDKKEAQEKNRP